MATNFLTSSQKQYWCFFNNKQLMEEQMKSYQQQLVNKYLKVLNLIYKIEQQKGKIDSQQKYECDYDISTKDMEKIQVPGQEIIKKYELHQLFQIIKEKLEFFQNIESTTDIFQECIKMIKINCGKKYNNQICMTAMAYFRRFFFKNCCLEYNPYHVAVVCIFLAAKTEERTDINLESFFMQNFYNDPKLQGLIYANNNHNIYSEINSIFTNGQSHDRFQGLRNLEIAICRSINFQFQIHNSIQTINHIKYLLIDYFEKKNEVDNNGEPLAQHLKNTTHLYYQTFQGAQDLLIIQYKSLWELAFCYTPNLIALASIHMAFETKNIHNLFIPVIYQLIGLDSPDIQEQIQKVKLLMKQSSSYKTNESNLKKTEEFMNQFNEEETSKFFRHWIQIYDCLKEKNETNEDWDSEDENQQQDQQQNIQNDQIQVPLTQKSKDDDGFKLPQPLIGNKKRGFAVLEAQYKQFSGNQADQNNDQDISDQKRRKIDKED